MMILAGVSNSMGIFTEGTLSFCMKVSTALMPT